MKKKQTFRRDFLKTSSAAIFGGAAGSSLIMGCKEEKETVEEEKSRFPISLAQWSLHRALKGGELDNLDFPKVVKEDYGIEGVEWVNQFFFVENEKLGAQPKDEVYLKEMKKRTDDLGVTNVLIMCDRVGNLGDSNEDKRSNAVVGHFAWVETAAFLGCHSIRVNARSNDKLNPEQQRDLCVDGLGRLSEFAKGHGINVIVENHGGLSSNGAWLASVMRGVGMDNCGTLPDFGNFIVAKNRGNAEKYAKAKEPFQDDPIYTETEYGLEYDRYQGVGDLMPFAKGVSAKAFEFDEAGNEKRTDFAKMMKIIADSGYEGYIGVEYEGDQLSEPAGIKATKKLLEKVIAGVA